MYPIVLFSGDFGTKYELMSVDGPDLERTKRWTTKCDNEEALPLT